MIFLDLKGIGSENLYERRCCQRSRKHRKTNKGLWKKWPFGMRFNSKMKTNVFV